MATHSFSTASPHDELKAFLLDQYSPLDEKLRDHVDGQLVYDIQYNDMDIKECFIDTDDGLAFAMVLRLKVLLQSIIKVNAKAKADADKAPAAAARKVVQKSSSKAITSGPPVSLQSWGSIVKQAKANAVLKEKGANDEDLARRKKLERDGAEVTIATPKLGSYQEHHAWLLNGTVDDIRLKLKPMGCTLRNFNPGDGVGSGMLCFFVSGGALGNHFAACDKTAGAKINFTKPLSYQNFWGEGFVGAARDAARDKETEFARKHTAEDLGCMRDKSISHIEQQYTSKMKAQEGRLGELTTRLLLAPEQHKPLAEKLRGSEQHALERLVK